MYVCVYVFFFSSMKHAFHTEHANFERGKVSRKKKKNGLKTKRIVNRLKDDTHSCSSLPFYK